MLSAGSGPFGHAEPELGVEPPADTEFCRFIDPVTRDYYYDPTSRTFGQMPRVRQRVLLTLLTQKGSATALRTWGIKMPRVMGSFFENETEAAVREALHQMVEVEKVMKIDAILVERGTMRCKVTVVYHDLTTGRADTAATGDIPLNG